MFPLHAVRQCRPVASGRVDREGEGQGKHTVRFMAAVAPLYT